MVPLIAYLVSLKVIRILGRQDATGVVGFLDLVRSDVLMSIALAVFWGGVLACLRNLYARRAGMVAMHIAALVTALWATSAHLFYIKTGSPLDLAMLRAAWSAGGDIRGVIAAEVSGRHNLWLLLLVVHCTVGPGLVGVVMRRLARRPLRRPHRPHPRRHGWQVFLATASTSALLVVLAAIPGHTAAGFSRDPLLNTVIAPIEAKRFSQELDLVPPTADELPIDTSLATTDRTRQRNVVMVFLESVRASATTLEVPTLPTTPFLSRLAKTSLVATNAYAVVPHTSKALTAGHCGVAPPLDMEVTEAKPRGIHARCLPELLGEQGYRSAFFQSATQNYENRAGLVANLGYDEFFPVEDLPKEGFAQANYFGMEDDIMLEPSRRWLQADDDRPFLAAYLTVTSHHDYTVPSTFPTKHLSDDPELNRYLNTVRYQDRFVKRLIQQYKRLGLYRDTIFVVMADHGEGFGEHGLRQHDNTIYSEGIQIPLLIHDPAKPRPQRLTHPVQSTGVLPTVADLLGFDIVGGSYAGTSFVHPASSPEGAASRIRIACWVDDRCMASIHGDEKYIFHFRQRPDEFFDLSTDPEERHNLIEQQDPDKIAALRADLLRWRAHVRGMTALRRSADAHAGKG
jgi:lipoteichoic acid synthase